MQRGDACRVDAGLPVSAGVCAFLQQWRTVRQAVSEGNQAGGMRAEAFAQEGVGLPVLRQAACRATCGCCFLCRQVRGRCERKQCLSRQHPVAQGIGDFHDRLIFTSFPQGNGADFNGGIQFFQQRAQGIWHNFVVEFAHSRAVRNMQLNAFQCLGVAFTSVKIGFFLL